MNSANLNDTEYAPFYSGYIKGLGNVELLDILTSSEKEITHTLRGLSEEKQLFRYAEGKWTIKELLLHIIDAERVLSYRALRFARNDSTDLPGFDEDAFVEYSNAHQRSMSELLKEFSEVRAASISLFKSFSEETLKLSGTANGSPMTVRALGFIISGHALHHLKIIKERYL